MKNAFGLDTVDTNGIDVNNPVDDNEKTTIILSKVVQGFDMAITFAYLAIFLLFIGMLVVFIKPNSIVNPLIFSLCGGLMILSGLTSRQAGDLARGNIGLIGDYYGFTGKVDTFSFKLDKSILIPIIFFFLIALVCILLKTTAIKGNEIETVFEIVFFTCAIVSVIAVFLVCIFLFSKGIPTIGKIGVMDFVFGTVWQPTGDNPQFGIFNLILTSLFGMLGAIIIGVPMGILVAICISMMTPKWLSRILGPTIDLLAGIPSVVYGAIGAIVLVPFVMNTFKLPTGATLFSAIIILSIMVLPTITSVSVISIRAVPQCYLEGALALGAHKETAVFTVVVPAARSGIMAGVMLGLGRAIGEAMAIILVAGNVPIFPKLFQPVRFLTTGIVAEMGYATGLHRDALFAIGMVLFIFIMILNSAFHILIKKAGVN
jgi:phosphate transport system permease protein